MMKPENPPNVRQSRLVFGLKKLKANSRKTAELMKTRGQSPYAGASLPWFIVRLLAQNRGA